MANVLQRMLPLLFLGSCCQPVLSQPEITFNGFGTVGGAYNFSDGVGIIRNAAQPDGPRGELSFDMDSRLGAQLDARFNDSFSATVQGVSRYNYEGKYDPILSWAFLKYQPNENFQLRIGRTGWDIYALADSTNVGYSLLWARPPVEYYGKLLFESLDGADLTATGKLGGGILSGKLYWGASPDKLGLDEDNYLDLDGSRFAGFNLSYSINEWLFRANYARADSEVAFHGPFASGLGQLLQVLPSLADILTLDDVILEIYSVAALYEQGPLQAHIMYSEDNYSKTVFADKTKRGFATLGYRIGDFTPFIRYARTSSAPREQIALPPDPQLLAFADFLMENQQSLAVGVRYDFTTNMALKFQVDHYLVEHDGEEAVILRENQPNWDGEATLVSLVLDFIF